MATPTKPAKSCRLGVPNRRSATGTDRTTGKPILLTEARTTCALSAVSDARVEAARLWLPSATNKPVSKQDFISLAVDELTKRLLAEHPDFKLPPSCAFVITPQ